jgi:multidrug resistance efflux pump
VHKGDILFAIEPQDYQYALAQAEANVNSCQADLTIRSEELKRRQKLGLEAISIESLQQAQSAQQVATANLQTAMATLDIAKLNLQRTEIHSPVNGYVTNLHLRIGDYANVGETKLSIIDSDSFWIAGYFEETKLPYIHPTNPETGYPGDHATVKLMGVSPDIEGHVESFARGIADSNGGTSGQGLADVNPVFTWVRLAQRIPIRIHIDSVPKGVKIAAGQTCTIVLSPAKK